MIALWFATNDDCPDHVSALLDQTLCSLNQTRERFLQESKRIQAYVDMIEAEEQLTTKGELQGILLFLLNTHLFVPYRRLYTVSDLPRPARTLHRHRPAVHNC